MMAEPPKNSQRIAKLLARAGVASRREIERMIEERRIAINGVPLETPATIVTSLAGITVDGNPVAAAEPTRLFRYHKPTGLLTAERDMKGRATIYDKLPADLPRTVPVGRLDLTTEGLLLMTTDGALKRRLELPSTGVPRSYRARAYGPVTQAQLEELIHGIEIDGVRYGQIDANLERRTGTNVWIEMTLKEGKNREVRRVLEHLGLRVSRLIRTRYGPFALEDLPPGAVEEVKQHELVEFLKELGSAEPEPAPEPGVKTTALRKHWRIAPSKGARPSTPGRGRRTRRAPERSESHTWDPIDAGTQIPARSCCALKGLSH
jgi:23S rRNA pseudouridine2605 synthase